MNFIFCSSSPIFCVKWRRQASAPFARGATLHQTKCQNWNVVSCTHFTPPTTAPRHIQAQWERPLRKLVCLSVHSSACTIDFCQCHSAKHFEWQKREFFNVFFWLLTSFWTAHVQNAGYRSAGSAAGGRWMGAAPTVKTIEHLVVILAKVIDCSPCSWLWNWINGV